MTRERDALTRRRPSAGASRAALAVALCAGVSACARGQAPTPPSPSTCERQAEIDALDREAREFVQGAHEMQEELKELQRELETATSEDQRARLRAEVQHLEQGVDVFFAESDVHRFKAKKLARECERAREEEAVREPAEDPPCVHDAEIAQHERERARFSEAMHGARAELDVVERALESAESEEEREALRAEIGELQGSEAVYYTAADRHYFATKRLREECEKPNRRRRRR